MAGLGQPKVFNDVERFPCLPIGPGARCRLAAFLPLVRGVACTLFPEIQTTNFLHSKCYREQF